MSPEGPIRSTFREVGSTPARRPASTPSSGKGAISVAESLPSGYRPSTEPGLDSIVGVKSSKLPWSESSIGFQRDGAPTARTTLCASEPFLELGRATELKLVPIDWVLLKYVVYPPEPCGVIVAILATAGHAEGWERCVETPLQTGAAESSLTSTVRAPQSLT